jgi:hypothetical protein
MRVLPDQERDEARTAKVVAVCAGAGLLASAHLIFWPWLIFGLSGKELGLLAVGSVLVLTSLGIAVGRRVGWWTTTTPPKRRVVLRELRRGAANGLTLGLSISAGLVVLAVLFGTGSNWWLVWWKWFAGLVGGGLTLSLLLAGAGAWRGARKGAALATFYRDGQPGTLRLERKDV